MADDQFHQASGNWWDHNSARNNNMRFESGASSSSSQSSISSSGIANNNNNNFASMDSSSSVVFHDHHHKLQTPDSATSTDPNLHMMGLGLSSPTMDWNQASLLRGEKGGENSFRSMLQENLGSSRSNFQESGMLGLSQVQWRAENNGGIRGNNNNNNFSLDQNQFSPQYSSGDSTVTTSFHHHNMDSTALYGSPSSILMQGLLGPENSSHQQQQQAMNFNLSYPSSYGLSSSNNDLVVPSNWSNNSNNKVPQFLRGSPPKQLPPPQPQPQPHNSSNNNQLHFTNNAPFWNASDAAAAIKDVRSSFFPSLQQPPFSTPPNFDVQSKNVCEVRESGGAVKKSGSEPTPKRPRNETNPSPLPAFKVRKEKMGDRITALQQLVSPFGKTDTASVLSEAIEYIKFLHEQVNVLSTPYMKSGAPIQIQQSSGKSKEGDGPKQDLRSRGLCLVPVSSTFPVTHETTVDFWTPTFGGSSR